jgi:hypothetical protein
LVVVRVGSLTVANTAVDQDLLPGQRTARRPRLDSRRGGPFTGFARALAARPILQAAAFLLLSLLTHLPGFTRALWNPDEAFLGTQGRVLAGGGRLYIDVVDRKPPILPYLYALAVTIGGDNAIWLMRGLAVFAHAATALLLAAIARHLGAAAPGSPPARSSACQPRSGADDAQLASFRFSCCRSWSARSISRCAAASAEPGSRAGATLAQVAGATLLPSSCSPGSQVTIRRDWTAGRPRGWRGCLPGISSARCRRWSSAGTGSGSGS